MRSVGLQQLINDPRAELASYGGGVFPLEAEDVRDLIAHALGRLGAPGGLEPPAVPVLLESMSGDAWRAYRDSLRAWP
jgi:hypothetical protein